MPSSNVHFSPLHAGSHIRPPSQLSRRCSVPVRACLLSRSVDRVNPPAVAPSPLASSVPSPQSGRIVWTLPFHPYSSHHAEHSSLRFSSPADIRTECVGAQIAAARAGPPGNDLQAVARISEAEGQSIVWLAFQSEAMSPGNPGDHADLCPGGLHPASYGGARRCGERENRTLLSPSPRPILDPQSGSLLDREPQQAVQPLGRTRLQRHGSLDARHETDRPLWRRPFADSLSLSERRHRRIVLRRDRATRQKGQHVQLSAEHATRLRSTCGDERSRSATNVIAMVR